MESGAEVIAQGGSVERGFFFGSVSIDFSTNALNMIDDLAGGVVLSAFEDTMLDVMRHTIFVW